jgi:hypothetical protein
MLERLDIAVEHKAEQHLLSELGELFYSGLFRKKGARVIFREEK